MPKALQVSLRAGSLPIPSLMVSTGTKQDASAVERSCAVSAAGGWNSTGLACIDGATTTQIVATIPGVNMLKLPSAFHAGKPRGRRAVAILAAALVATSSALFRLLAQKWPERSITLIVPFAAGGASDVSSRIMADVMSKHLGQSVIIENVAGAGGATGSLRGKNAKPDGYTIGFGHMGTHAACGGDQPEAALRPQDRLRLSRHPPRDPARHDRAQGVSRPIPCRSSLPTPRPRARTSRWATTARDRWRT